MTHKQYLNEKILKIVLKKLDQIKQQQENSPINLTIIQILVEQAQQH